MPRQASDEGEHFDEVRLDVAGRRGEKASFMRALQTGPVVDDDLDVERSAAPPRDIDMTE